MGADEILRYLKIRQILSSPPISAHKAVRPSFPMKQTQVIFLGVYPEQRVCGLILSGARRYAASRRWGVRFLSWQDALAGNLRDAVGMGDTLGFVVECGDGPGNLPVELYDGLPAVFVNCTETPVGKRFARIPIDNEAIARAAFRELSSSRPSAYAVVDLRHAKGNWPDRRVKAFKAAVAEAGERCHAFLFRHPMAKDTSPETKRLAAWLADLPRRTAVFAVNDQTSADVVEAVRIAHLRIPKDLTLLGVDNNLEICEASSPTLSSIQVDFENAGFLAARLLAAGMTDRALRGMTAAAIAANDAALRANDIIPSLPPQAACHCGEAARHCASGALSLQRPDGGDDVSVGPLLAVRRESTLGFGRREPNILAAVEMIRREACDGLAASELISRFPGSRWLFEMRFREAMGHSVLDEILHVRLERACILLARTDTSIDAISDFCGFGSPRSLRAHFLARIGMSMREFRARNRG